MLKHSLLIVACCGVFIAKLSAQTHQEIHADLHPETHSINIQQDITFHNQTQDTLNAIYLYDWNNAYSTKKSELAKRFGEEFDKSLHLASKDERGTTDIINITDKNFNFLQWDRSVAPDIIKVQLQFPIYPDGNYSFKLSYVVKLPIDKFTRYGYGDNSFDLRYWYLSPAVHEEGQWKLYNNKNLDDQYNKKTDFDLTLSYPEDYKLVHELGHVDTQNKNNRVISHLAGKDRFDIKLVLRKINTFSTYQTEHLTLITDLNSKDLDEIEKVRSVEKIADFIYNRLGQYPHDKLLVTDGEYRKNPLYGLNQLPSFLRPFPETFQFELKLLKTALNNYLENVIPADPREEKWITDAIQTYLMMEYVDQYYPKMKLLGNISKVWGVRSFHLAKMDFNDQYPFLYMLMARKNLDQPLDTPRDSLIKFNEKIANKYKSGLGLKYVADYLDKEFVSLKIQQYYQEASKNNQAPDFEQLLEDGASKDIHWFFEEYVHSNKRIDFKIKSIKKLDDSISVIIKNKTGTQVPITLFGIDPNDSIISKNWLTNVQGIQQITIPNNNIKKLVLNYDKTIPEFNQRDNWKSTGGFLSSNKKLRFQFFKDAEDPYYNQVFYVPIAGYNYYDGFTPGLRFYNKTFLDRQFVYDLRPSYGTGEKALVGSGALLYRKYIQNGSLYLVNYSLRGSSFHYAPGLRYSTITPSVGFAFRTNDLRSNEKEFLTLRHVNVIRDQVPEIKTDPDYSVFNARYSFSNDGIIEHLSWFTDVQVANKFSKLSVNLQYRKLFQNNTQVNLRFFAGKFIYNETNSDFFSFALDRPTDYLFDYDYLGRSESTGLFSQQLIIAEGGFKSKLQNPYSNNWMATVNGSVNLWRWVELYGDAGMMKNKLENPRVVYDSGIRLNLVTDYFELYFPLYSNNGWEIGQPRYDQRIRFIITLSPRTLTGLFTRKWF